MCAGCHGCKVLAPTAEHQVRLCAIIALKPVALVKRGYGEMTIQDDVVEDVINYFSKNHRQAVHDYLAQIGLGLYEEAQAPLGISLDNMVVQCVVKEAAQPNNPDAYVVVDVFVTMP